MNYITFNDLKNLNKDKKVLVSRVCINTKLAKFNLNAVIRNESFLKLLEVREALEIADASKNRPVYGVTMKVGDVLSIFTENELGRTGVALFAEEKEKEAIMKPGELVKNDISKELGLPYEDIAQMEIEEVEKLIEAKSGEKIKPSLSIHRRIITEEEINANIDETIAKHRNTLSR